MNNAFLLQSPVGGAPVWVAYAALTVSIILAIVRVVEFVLSRRVRTAVDIALTRDLFFRYTETGEMLFVNAVLSASDSPAIVLDVRGELRRKDGTKTFPLRLLRIGEPADRGGTIHDHYFFSSSPTDLLPVDMPIRRIYLFVVDEYDNVLKEACDSFQVSLRTLLPPLVEAHGLGDAETTTRLLNEIEESKNTLIRDYSDGVQLEAADYEIEIACEYREHKKRTTELKTAVSVVTFKIGGPVRDTVRGGWETISGGIIQRIFSGKVEDLAYPSVVPEDVRVKKPG